MDAKKQNRIIVGTAVILMTVLWIGYAIFTMVLDRTYMQAVSAFYMASTMIMAMVALTAVKSNAKQAVAYTEQIPVAPVKAPWEEETYMQLKTHAARAMWVIYRITGNNHPEMFYLWVTDHLAWRPGSEESQNKAFDENLSTSKMDGNVDNYLFDVSNENWYHHDDIGNGEIKCFVLNFWERQADGSKKWMRVFITDQSADIYLQPGVSDGRSESMDPTDKPKLIESALLKDALEGFNVQ